MDLIEPDFGREGLVAVVAQDHETGEVLMVAHMNREAYEETLRTGRACYWSRSRGRLWRKGEESGHVQHVKEIFFDCDADALLLRIHQVGGAACHEGYRSCFFRRRRRGPTGQWSEVQTIGKRVFDPAEVYGPNKGPATANPKTSD